MSFKDDYIALVKAWKGSSLVTKLLLCGYFVVTSGAIASISETVAKFSGFIVTAVQFYRRLTKPLALLLAAPQLTVDAVVLFLVFLGAAFLASIAAKDRVFGISSGEWKLVLLLWVTGLLVGVFGRSLDASTRSAVSIFAVILVTLLWDLVRAFVHVGNNKLKRHVLHIVGIEANPTKRLQSRQHLSFFGAAVLFVALIAAISKGLTVLR